MERRMIEEIIKEQKFQVSSLSAASISKVGNLLGVKYIVTGDISKPGKTFLITAKMLDVESGRICKTAVFDSYCSYEYLVKYGSKYIALQLSGKITDDEQFYKKYKQYKPALLTDDGMVTLWVSIIVSTFTSLIALAAIISSPSY